MATRSRAVATEGASRSAAAAGGATAGGATTVGAVGAAEAEEATWGRFPGAFSGEIWGKKEPRGEKFKKMKGERMILGGFPSKKPARF